MSSSLGCLSRLSLAPMTEKMRMFFKNLCFWGVSFVFFKYTVTELCG